MDNAQLDMGLREDAVYRIREALQTIHTSNQDVLKAFMGSSQKTESMVTPVFATPILTISWLA